MIAWFRDLFAMVKAYREKLPVTAMLKRDGTWTIMYLDRMQSCLRLPEAICRTYGPDDLPEPVAFELFYLVKHHQDERSILAIYEKPAAQANTVSGHERSE